MRKTRLVMSVWAEKGSALKLLPKAGDVISQRANFSVIELVSHLAHLQAIFSDTVSERRELCRNIFGMLTGKARVLRWNASTVRAVATRTGCDLAIRHATTVNALAQGDQFFVFGKTGFCFFRGCPISDVFHVVFRQRTCKSSHDGVFALAGFELLQLLDEVFRMLL